MTIGYRTMPPLTQEPQPKLPEPSPEPTREIERIRERNRRSSPQAELITSLQSELANAKKRASDLKFLICIGGILAVNFVAARYVGLTSTIYQTAIITFEVIFLFVLAQKYEVKQAVILMEKIEGLFTKRSE